MRFTGGLPILHLSKEIGIPEICTIDTLMKRDTYLVLIGAKRLIKKGA